MASINKLAIRGVRAFSPDDDEQVISFGFPLTIIVGSNGCGKTTIIEALKYAITGAMPPGVKSGQAFVHDPKSAGQSNVKASIKLRFTNRAGNSMVVIRSMEVSQKKSTLTFKALDGVLRTANPDTGEKISMSHKCTELDRQIPTLIGVSKAILEHVVFCHQEDSSWPLSEGAILKKRFDEIFDSTRYAKALKAIMEVKKDYSAKAKELKVELASLAAFKHTAGQFCLEMEEVAEKISEGEEVIKECEEKIKVQDVTIAKYIAELETVSHMEADADEKKSELDQAILVMESQRNMLEEDLTQRFTRPQLERAFQDSDSYETDTVQLLQEKLDKQKTLKGELENIQREKDRLVESRVRLNTELTAHERNLEERSRKIRHIASTYGIEIERDFILSNLTQTQSSASGLIIGATQESNIGVASFSEEQVNVFMQKLNEKKSELETQLIQLKRRQQKEQDDIMSELGILHGKQASNEKEKRKISEEMETIKSEIDSISTQKSSYSFKSVRKSDVEEAKRMAAGCAKAFEELSNDKLLESIPNQIKENQDKIEKIKRDIDALNEVLSELRKHAEHQQTLTSLKTEIEKDTLQLQDSIEENKDGFRRMGFSIASLDLPSIEAVCNDIEGKMKKGTSESLPRANQVLSEKQMRVTENATISEHYIATLAQLTNRLQSLDISKITAAYNDICRFQKEFNKRPFANTLPEPKDLIQHLDERIRELDEDSMSCASDVSIRVFKKLQKMSVIKNAAGESLAVICPCCTRDLPTDDAKKFQDKMKEFMDPLRSVFIKTDEAIEKEKALFKRCRDIVASDSNIWYERFRLNKEIQGLETALAQKKEEKTRLQIELDDAQRSVDALKSEVEKLTISRSEAIRLRDIAQRIEEKKFSMKHLKNRFFSHSSDGRSLTQVESEYSELHGAKDKLTEENSKLNRQVAILNSKISAAASATSESEKAAREKEALYQQGQEMTGRVNILEEKLSLLSEQEKKLEDQDAPTRQAIMAKQSDLDLIRSSQTDSASRAESFLQSFRQECIELGETIKNVNQYLTTNKPSELGKIQERLGEIDATIKQRFSLLSSINSEIEKLKQEQNQKGQQKKKIQGNLSLLDSLDKIEILKNQWSDLCRKLEAVRQQSDAEEKCSIARENKERFKEKKTRCEGRMGGLKDQLKSLKLKLKSSEYNDVDERHRIKMIEHQTTLLAVSDLEKYYTALDKALMKFHSIKISDINKIIRELWSMTYKGEDIYNIEIVSGEEGASKAAKSYNYRVVMSKGSTKMDMRGRCSAGQRVLACLVIRLALAETFCLNCGLMCLDEPTTNLDHANKQGLAIALAQIIATRASQRNFQLVVITHDEEFVHMMKTELATQTGFDMPERYFHISREESVDGKFYSRIRAIDWDVI